MLKHQTYGQTDQECRQPPSGGCVLKPIGLCRSTDVQTQPPSGGCVLKLACDKMGKPEEGSRLQAAVC